jgi:opacity protein-like surface antigen
MQFGAFLALCSTSVFAASGHYYVAGSLGVSDASIQKSTGQYVVTGGEFTDYYNVNGTDSIDLFAGLRGGYEFTGAGNMPSIAVGLGLYASPTGYTYNGNVSETPIGDPTYMLYRYNYNINVIRLMLEAQFLWQIAQIMPFINVGVGPAWVKLNGYQETPVSSTGFVALPPFAPNTSTNLAWQAGFGAAYAFKNQDRIALEYRYVYLGNTSFGSRGAVYPYALNIGQLNTNDIFLTFTHFIS